MLGLGSATLLGPMSVEVRSLQSWMLVYRAGAAGIQPGGGIRIALRHLMDFGRIQTDDPSAEGYVSVSTPLGGPFELYFEPSYGGRFFNQTFPWQNFIQITIPDESLSEGQEIRVGYGDPQFGSPGLRVQSFDEDRFEFKVYVDTSGDGVYLPVENSPSIEVTAGKPDHVQIVMPSDAVVDEATWAIVRVEDRYGNPTSQFEGEVEVVADTKTTGFDSRITFRSADRGVRKISGIRFQEEGDFRISVSSSMGTASGNPVRVRARTPERKLLWGDLHGHTLLSDGRGTVDAFYDFARNVAGLDVCAVTDHAFEVTDAQWKHSKEITNRWYAPDEFVTFQAYEWSGMTEVGGDHNVFFLDEDPPIFRSDSYYDALNLEMYHGVEPQAAHVDDLFDRLESSTAENGVFAIPHWGGRRANPEFHHPEIQRMVEIFSEHRRSTEWALQFLHRGYRVGIMASTDSHFGNPGYGFLRPVRENRRQDVGHALVAIQAQSLTRESVFSALHARRVYATTGERIRLEFHVNGQPMGSELLADRSPVLEVEVVGTAAIDRVEIMRDGEILHVVDGDSSRVVLRWIDEDFRRGTASFYFVRVVQVDGEEAISSPVWISFEASGGPVD